MAAKAPGRPAEASEPSAMRQAMQRLVDVLSGLQEQMDSARAALEEAKPWLIDSK